MALCCGFLYLRNSQTQSPTWKQASGTGIKLPCQSKVSYICTLSGNDTWHLIVQYNLIYQQGNHTISVQTELAAEEKRPVKILSKSIVYSTRKKEHFKLFKKKDMV